jgi:hypothetical protein
MEFEIDIMFRAGASYDDLVSLIEANPKYVFYIAKQDRIDKRTKRAKESGWIEVRHKNALHKGVIRLSKKQGVCRASVRDQSGGLKLIGAWTSWLFSNGSELISGLDLRIA